MWTNKGKADLGRSNPETAVLRLLWVTAEPASAAAAADLNFVADVVANEVAGAARQTLSTVAVGEDDTGDGAPVTAANPAAITGVNGPQIKGVWVYRRVGGADSDAADILWCFLNTPDVTTNGTPVTFTFPGGVVFTIT